MKSEEASFANGSSDSSATLELTTSRLVLRPFDESEAGLIEDLLRDREIASNTRSIPYPYPSGAAAEWIVQHRAMMQQGDAYHFAIRLGSTDTLLGSIGLEVNKEDHHAELGYWLGRPYWNRGYCTEAARCLTEFGFEALGLHRITSHHLTRNPASGRVLEKIGMSKEGMLRGHVRKWGVFEDIELYGMLASDPRP